MIKTIAISNVYGISNQNPVKLDFSLKYVRESEDALFEQIISNKGEHFMLIPTFISKNASGKTSILRSISLATKLIENHEDLFDVIGDDTIDSINNFWTLYTFDLFSSLRTILSRDMINEERAVSDCFWRWKSNIVGLFNRYDPHFVDFNAMEEHNKILSTLKKINRLAKAKDKLDNVEFVQQFIKNFVDFFDENTLIFSELIKKMSKIKISQFVNSIRNNQLYDGIIEISIKGKSPIKIEFTKKGELKIQNKPIVLNTYLSKLTMNRLTANTILEKLDKQFENSIFGFLESIEKEITKLEKNSPIHSPINHRVIDDSIIRNNLKSGETYLSHLSTFVSSNNDNNLIRQIVEKYGFKFTNKLLATIDDNISHIEKGAKGQYHIVQKENENYLNVSSLSFGTLKTLYIINESYSVFKDGGIVLIDEIENGLNASLINLIVSFYTDEDINVGRGQLFLTTHVPYIFERNIIKNHNAFVFLNKKFEKVTEVANITKRTATYESMFLSKNYFNEYFWKKYELSDTSTINNTNIEILLGVIDVK